MVAAFLAGLVALNYVLTLLYGRNGGCISRRTADAQLLELMYERSLGVARRMLRKPFLRRHGIVTQGLTLRHGRQQMSLRLGILGIVVVGAFAVDLQESVELDDFTGGYELFFTVAQTDIDRCLFQTGIGHLAGHGTFPYQVVEPVFLCRTLNALALHVCRTNGLVSFLCALGMGVILAWLMIVSPPSVR